MRLKRLYQMNDEGAVIDAQGRPAPDDPAERWIPSVIGVEILSLGATPEQHWSPDFITGAIGEGWLTQKGDKITLEGEVGGKTVKVAYKVLRAPGYYCCHCKAPMDDGASARAHIVASHPETDSPDPANPSGYERIHYYDCVETDPRNPLLEV